jgi:mannose-6-phosphate isomerase-like protein (cupin superfamily)
MQIKSILALAFIVSGWGVVTLAQSPMPPATYMSAAEIAAGIENTAGDRPGMAVGSFITNDDYRINMIHRTEAAGAIVHEVGTELHYITAGAGTLVTGGVIVRPAGGGRATIEGGKTQRVSVGDAILIPENTPHWYSAVEGSVTYLEVRF